VGNIIAFPVTVFLSFALSRLIRFVLEEDVFPRMYVHRGISYAISVTIHYAILFGVLLLQESI
jgi:potassium efflux system protein